MEISRASVHSTNPLINFGTSVVSCHSSTTPAGLIEIKHFSYYRVDRYESSPPPQCQQTVDNHRVFMEECFQYAEL